MDLSETRLEKLHEERLNLYYSPNIIWVFKSRKKKWAGDVVSMGGVRETKKCLSDSLKGRDHLRNPGVDVIIMIIIIITTTTLILRKYGMRD